MCLLTHPHSLHLGPERIQQLKQDQSQRVNVHFMRVRVSRELPGKKEMIQLQILNPTQNQHLYKQILLFQVKCLL